MANMFSVEPANPLQALMTGVQGYDAGQKRMKEAEVTAGRAKAMQALQGGGDLRNVLGELMGVGDIQGAKVIADFAENQAKVKAEESGVFGTPIYGTNDQGVTGLGVITKRGELKQISAPGFKVTPGVMGVDTGTGTQLIERRSGQPVGGPQAPLPQQPQAQLNQPAPAPAPAQAPASPATFDQRFTTPPAPGAVSVPTQRLGGTPGFIPKDVAGKARETKVGTEEGQNITDFGKAEAALKTTYSALDNMALTANQVMEHPGLSGITGIQGKFPNIPGFQAADANALLETLKSQVAFGVLQAMREASKTGGALGNVSDAEGKRLEANLAALDRAQSVEAFKAAMARIVKYTKEAKQRTFGAFQQDYGRLRQQTPAAAPETPAALDPLGIR